MVREIKLPNIGDFKAVEVIEVLVQVGDTVAKDDSLLTLESDKATMDVPARRLGVPQSSRDSFKLLADEQLIAPELSARLQRMIGFRNIAVHQYQSMDLAIVEAILHRDLDDLLAFCQIIVRL